MIGLILIPAFVIWFIVSAMLSSKIPDWLGIRRYATALTFILFPFVLVAPIADEIIGAIYMKKMLCEDSQGLTIVRPIESIREAKSVPEPKERIWFGIPIIKLQTNYIDVDTEGIFAYSRTYVTYGGVLMRAGLNLGHFSGCSRFSLGEVKFSGPSQDEIAINKLLKKEAEK